MGHEMITKILILIVFIGIIITASLDARADDCTKPYTKCQEINPNPGLHIELTPTVYMKLYQIKTTNNYDYWYMIGIQIKLTL